MKKKIIVLVLTIGLLSFTTPKESDMAEKGSLTITVEGIEKKKGQIVFMLFDQEDGFPKETDKAFKKGIIKSFDTSAEYTFENIPYGTYAVAIFHDEDSDGEIKSNFIGMPKESVGASNMTKMGKPSFEKCAFELTEVSMKLTMKFII